MTESLFHHGHPCPAKERKLVMAIRDAAIAYLAASNYAERYIYGHAFANALIAYNEHALEVHRKKAAV